MHNQTDIAFATEMIPHHAQAASMSKLAPNHASSPQVKDLATRIAAAQQPEIDQMSGFLRTWNAPVPDTNGAGMGDMMSPAQMQQLGQADGAAFDKMFLQMMISHHEGAITMAQTETSQRTKPRRPRSRAEHHHRTTTRDHRNAHHAQPGMSHR
ncbi:MAG: DUF305 domain-containing protein [Pseudonocardiaceae bacterium]